MGIYIPGMKMPKSCASCPCANDETPFCPAAKKYLPVFGKPEWCPIIELPPHGRLIDADAFLARNAYFADREFVNPRYDDTLEDLIDRADTVLPADPEGGEDG